MDQFLLYLIAINAVTFVAFVLDFLLCMWKPGLEDAPANALVMDVFPIAGGALGMLLALFVLTGLGRGRRMNKDNVAWWFLAIVCLIAWGLIASVRLGLVGMSVSIDGLFSGWNLDKLKVLGIYLVVVNIITFIVFALDKRAATREAVRSGRTPEARLLGLCLAGGSVGGMLAMHVVRHKTKKRYFVWGLPCFVVLHIAVVLYAHMVGII
ncbi:MAG: DUF1294 domain-containing protein [Atopobiaceae bacterium]|nr:DUF1294 domain-containing protein [Atopobiaceae bacterium]